jgi:hypothetical protein
VGLEEMASPSIAPCFSIVIMAFAVTACTRGCACFAGAFALLLLCSRSTTKSGHRSRRVRSNLYTQALGALSCLNRRVYLLYLPLCVRFKPAPVAPAAFRPPSLHLAERLASAARSQPAKLREALF